MGLKNEIFSSVIRQTGGKFTYSHASEHANRLQIKESVELLELAGIIYPVTHTSANGLPLAAEVDYVVQYNTDIVPIEVKSGTKGSMQSMFQFLSEKEYAYGIRCSMENFGTYQNIKVYPLYAVSQIGKF